MKTHSLRVLVVDDSITVRMDLRNVLTAAGFSVTLCESKAAVQRELMTGTFDLVILDVILPDGDGVELLRQLRANPVWLGIPVILLSTEAEVESRIRGLQTGAVEYIGKPYDSTYLVQRALEWSGAEDSESLAHAARGVGGKKILAVDDSPTFLMTLAAQLRYDRHEVVLARSGEQALRMLASQPVDCILMDLIMPGLDGAETCRRIKAMPERQDIPIIMLTGADDGESRTKGMAAGIDDYVVKSPRHDVVRVRVRMVLRRTRFRRSRTPDEAAPDRSGRNPGMSFLKQLIAASGLSEPLARDMIQKACRRSDEESISPADFLHALPSIHEAFGAHLPLGEASRRVGAMAAVARLAEVKHRRENAGAMTTRRKD